ncbi:hypothetical protein D3C81_1630920 [compost metagenome]
MQHVFDTAVTGFAAKHAGATTVIKVSNIALDQLEIRPLRRRDQPANLFQIRAMAGCKAVQPDHALIEFQQGLQQVAANEARNAGHQPGMAFAGQLLLQIFVRARLSGTYRHLVSFA